MSHSSSSVTITDDYRDTPEVLHLEENAFVTGLETMAPEWRLLCLPYQHLVFVCNAKRMSSSQFQR
jgi:hypothetical protein